MCRLLYGDPDLAVDRPTMMKALSGEAGYDRVFDYVDGKLTVVRSRPPRPEQTSTIHYSR